MKSLLVCSTPVKSDIHVSSNLFPKVSFLQPTEPIDEKTFSVEAEENGDGLDMTLNEDVDARNPRY